MKRVAIAHALLVISASSLLAQLDRGSLVGIVTDPSGAAVANARVTATHLDTNTTFATRHFGLRQLHAASAGDRSIPGPRGSARLSSCSAREHLRDVGRVPALGLHA